MTRESNDTTGKLALRECQRFMNAEAFGHVHRAATCPPVDDSCASIKDNNKWFCSAAVPGGMYRCPDRASTMQFCPGRSPCVQPEDDVTTGDVDVVKQKMCTSSKDFDPVVEEPVFYAP